MQPLSVSADRVMKVLDALPSVGKNPMTDQEAALERAKATILAHLQLQIEKGHQPQLPARPLPREIAPGVFLFDPAPQGSNQKIKGV